VIRETEVTRQREDETALDFSRAWNVGFVRRPALDAVDYDLLKDGHRVGIAEVKARDREFAEFPSVMLNMTKLAAGINEARATGGAFVLCFSFRGQCYWTKPADHLARMRLVVTGRTDRNDRHDIELAVHIPLDCWRPLAPPTGTNYA